MWYVATRKEKLDNEQNCRYMWRWTSLRKHAYSKFIENFTNKNWKFSDKKLWYFSYFCSKHRLWVLVWIGSQRRFSRVSTISVLSRNKKNNVYPCKLQFYYIKVGLIGSKLYRYVFVMVLTVPCAWWHLLTYLLLRTRVQDALKIADYIPEVKVNCRFVCHQL